MSIASAFPGHRSRSMHAYYKYYAFLRPDHLRPGWSRDRIVAEVTAKGVPCFSGSCPEMYDEKAFTRAGLQPPSRLPVARELGATSLMLLVDHTLDEGAIRPDRGRAAAGPRGCDALTCTRRSPARPPAGETLWLTADPAWPALLEAAVRHDADHLPAWQSLAEAMGEGRRGSSSIARATVSSPCRC